MSLITVSLYPNVPMLPGVPQLVRSALFPPSPYPTLSPQQSDLISQSASQASQWAILDSSMNPVLTPDSFLDFFQQVAFSLPTFPIQDGGFSNFNKVRIPQEIALRVSMGQGVSDRADFLDTLDDLAASLDIYAIVTPEKTYPSVNISRYTVTRRGKDGAFFLQDIDIFFTQIQQTTATYSTTQAASSTQNAQLPVSQPSKPQGGVQPGPAGLFNTAGQQPFVLGTPTSSLYQSIGPAAPGLVAPAGPLGF